MSVRELVVLGTSSRVPTRRRNHNGYLLRWDGHGFLFDPGEGTQRQLTLAGVAASTVDRVCLTHLHGDHCLGLPGVLQRLSLDAPDHRLDLHYPASGAVHVERLRHASIADRPIEVREHPDVAGTVADGPPATLVARELAHSVDTLGWRLEEPAGVTMLPERLAASGVEGADRARLREQGRLELDGRTVHLDEVSVPRPGQVFALVMDTGVCDGARALAADADLLVCEATFLEQDADLARRYGHLTAGQAGRLAAESGARRLVLTHFSQRYADPAAFGAEARAFHDDVVVAEDLLRVPVPPRRIA